MGRPAIQGNYVTATSQRLTPVVQVATELFFRTREHRRPSPFWAIRDQKLMIVAGRNRRRSGGLLLDTLAAAQIFEISIPAGVQPLLQSAGHSNTFPHSNVSLFRATPPHKYNTEALFLFRRREIIGRS